MSNDKSEAEKVPNAKKGEYLLSEIAEEDTVSTVSNEKRANK